MGRHLWICGRRARGRVALAQKSAASNLQMAITLSRDYFPQPCSLACARLVTISMKRLMISTAMHALMSSHATCGNLCAGARVSAALLSGHHGRPEVRSTGVNPENGRSGLRFGRCSIFRTRVLAATRSTGSRRDVESRVCSQDRSRKHRVMSHPTLGHPFSGSHPVGRRLGRPWTTPMIDIIPLSCPLGTHAGLARPSGLKPAVRLVAHRGVSLARHAIR